MILLNCKNIWDPKRWRFSSCLDTDLYRYISYTFCIFLIHQLEISIPFVQWAICVLHWPFDRPIWPGSPSWSAPRSPWSGLPQWCRSAGTAGSAGRSHTNGKYIMVLNLNGLFYFPLTLQTRPRETRAVAKQPRNEVRTTKVPTKIWTTMAMCSKVPGVELFNSYTDRAIRVTPISCQ